MLTRIFLVSGIFWEATGTKKRQKMHIKPDAKIYNLLINNEFVFK